MIHPAHVFKIPDRKDLVDFLWSWFGPLISFLAVSFSGDLIRHSRLPHK